MRIVFEDVHKSFGTLQVHKGVSFTIQEGKISVIMGGSGTGKSVLLKEVVGLLKPDSGRILVDNVDVVPLSEKQLHPIRRRIGMIFQSAGLLQSLNVEENIGLPLIESKGTHLSKQEVLELAREKLKIVGLEGFEKKPVSTLSGGQKKRAAIARALAEKDECLLFDEPTAGLDPAMSKTVDDIIVEVNRETGATCVVVTHDLVSAFTIADEIHLLHEGKIVSSGTKEDFQNSDHPVVVAFMERDSRFGKIKGTG